MYIKTLTIQVLLC